MGFGHGRDRLSEATSKWVQYGSGPCFLQPWSLAHLLIRVYHHERQLDGSCRYDVRADRLQRDRYCRQGDLGQRCGKSQGSRRKVPGPSFSDSAVEAMAPLLGEFTYAQWNAVYNALSFGFTSSGFPTTFNCLQVPNLTKSYRVIRDTSTRRDHGTSTSDQVLRAGASASGRVHRASACRVLRGVSTCCVRCASASGRVHRAVSTTPVAEPTAMSFTVPLTGRTIVATAAVVTMCSASAVCTDSVTPICSGSVCVSMSCGGSFTPDGEADHGKVHHQGVLCVCMLNEEGSQ